MEIKYANDNNFDELVFKSSNTVLVDFYAEWCGPCKMMGPVLEDMASNRYLDIIKVNVENSPLLAAKYNIYSIPTLMLVKNGQIVKMEPGFKPKTLLERFIED
ncbi:MAG: thioredoxin [Bacilli bacterium]|nr:thioredoxin [Bacilli bacterium]